MNGLPHMGVWGSDTEDVSLDECTVILEFELRRGMVELELGCLLGECGLCDASDGVTEDNHRSCTAEPLRCRHV